MYCPNCGNVIPDDSAFCTMCGAPVQQQNTQPPAPEYQQPYTNPAGYQQPYSTPASGQAFDPYAGQQYSDAYRPAPEAPKADPKAKMLVLVVTILCAVALIGSCIITQITSIENIPLFSIFGALGIDELKEEIGDEYDTLKDLYEDKEDDYTSKEQNAIEDFLDATKDLSDSFSINNMKALVSAAEGIDDLDLKGASSLADEVDQAMTVLNGMSGFMWGFMLFCLAFTLCGGLFKIKGLAITGLIFSIFYGLILCGFVYVVIFIAAHAALIVTINKAKAAA